MNLQESIRRILREDKDHTNLLKGIIDSSDIFDYKHFCGFDIITPEERSDQYNFLNKNKIPYLIKVYFVGGPNSEVWPRTQAVRNKELDLMEELHEYIKSFVPFNIEMMGSHVNSCEGYKKLMKRKYSTDDLQESIRRILREDKYDDKVGRIFWFEYHCYESPESCDSEIWYRSHQKVKVIGVSEWSFDDYENRMNDGQPRVYLVEWKDGFQYDVFEDELLESPNEFYRPNPPKRKIQESIRKILKEETEGINSFLDEISSKHNMSDELKDFVKQFIEESDCKRINFSGFKMPVMGLALESGVLINSVALNHPLPFLLFLILHEVAHQYQFKKYGEDVMYDCYLGEISEREAAEFMKHTEEVADDFAFRKIRQLQKLNLIEPYTPPQMYKNIPIQQITMMVNNYRNDMRRKNIDSPKKVSEYFYNMVKSEL
jgi:hypothetical protein